MDYNNPSILISFRHSIFCVKVTEERTTVAVRVSLLLLSLMAVNVIS